MLTIKHPRTGYRYYSGPLREENLFRATNIEILQSVTTTATIEMHQSTSTTDLLIMTHSRSIPSPDEDRQCGNRNVTIHIRVTKL